MTGRFPSAEHDLLTPFLAPCTELLNIGRLGGPRGFLEAVLPTQDPAAILSRLRTAQRQLDESARGSPDNDRLAARVRDLEAELNAAISAERGNDRSLHGRKPARRRA